MKHTIYRLLVFPVMLIVLSSPAALVAAQEDEPEGGRALNVACPAEEDLGGLVDALRAEHPGHEHPPIHGLLWHRDEHFSFVVPIDWQRSDWEDGRIGVLYFPVPDDPQTVFAVEEKDLRMVISAEDLDRLDAEYIDTIEQLPEAEVGQVVFSLALATLGTTSTSRRLLYASMGMCTSVALAGKPQSLKYPPINNDTH